MVRPRPDDSELKQYSLELNPRIVARLDRMARLVHVSRQALVRAIFREWVEEFTDYPLFEKQLE